MRVRRDTYSTRCLKYAYTSKGANCRHSLEAREFFAFISSKSTYRCSLRAEVITNHWPCKISWHCSCISFWNNNRRFRYSLHLSVLPVVVVSAWQFNLFQESNCPCIFKLDIRTLTFVFGLINELFSNRSARKIDVSNDLKHLCKMIRWEPLKRIRIRTIVICT